MTKTERVSWVLVLLLAAQGGNGAPAKYSTETEARALLEKAVALFQKNGVPAIATIGQPSGSFFQRDLFVFVIGPDGKIAADPAEPELVGADASSLRDPHGKPYALMIAKRASEDETTVDYEAKNPATRRIEDKTTLVVKSGGYVFACGYYLPPVLPAGKSGADTPSAPGERWAGSWVAKNDDGSKLTIKLDPSGSAESDHGEGQRGFWIVDQDHVRIDWTDGWTDYLVPSEDAYQRIGFSPGAPRDEKPTITTSVEHRKETAPPRS